MSNKKWKKFGKWKWELHAQLNDLNATMSKQTKD